LTEASKDELAKFLQCPEIKLWYDGVAPELKPSTRNLYLIYMMRYFGNDNPGTFLKRAQENPRQVAMEVKSKLGEHYKRSMNGAHQQKYALKSLLQFHEIQLSVNGKIKVRRVRQKPELTWENANRIIQETDEPYRSLFKFMLWSGLGEDELMEIQTSQEIQRRIDDQRNNEKPYVKIRLSPRKSNLDEFFTLIPKQSVPEFPLSTKTYKDRGRNLIDPHDLQNVWRRSAKKLGLWHEGLGPHQLRSCFKSQCGKSEVAYAVSEFCMGHGGGDRYGYSRETLDEGYMAKQLSKLWEHNAPAKPEELTSLRSENQELREKLEALERRVDSLGLPVFTWVAKR
jgi:hypothetical protein